MARCPECFAAELDPSGSCPSCGCPDPAGGTLDTLSQADTRGTAPPSDRPAGEDSFTSGTLLGRRYQVTRLLGRGGMGEVWQALDLKLRVDVALKRLRPEWVGNPQMLERLRGEARAARDVVSPNVCRIFDLIELDGDELVSMEFVDGTTLSDVLARARPARAARGDGGRLAVPGGAGGDPPGRLRAPRRQARERNAHPRRAGGGDGLRAGAAAGGRPHADAGGHAGLHGAGAAAGQWGRRTGGHLLGGDRAGGAARLLGRQGGAGSDPARGAGGAAAAAGQPVAAGAAAGGGRAAGEPLGVRT